MPHICYTRVKDRLIRQVSLTTASCSVTGNTVTLIAVGTCTLQASQAGDAAYLAATPVTNSFAITISSGGSESGGSGEIPTLPEWGAILLGLLLFAIVYRQRRNNGSGLPPSSFGTGLAAGPGAGRHQALSYDAKGDKGSE